MVSVICHNPKCKTKFQAQRSSAKYCSYACRDVMARARKTGSSEKRQKTSTCKYCGKTFAISSKGRTPVFCSDSHRVIWHNNVRAAAVYNLTHMGREFKRVSRDAALDFIEGKTAQQIIDMWAEMDYRFDGRQFVDIKQNPPLL